MSRNLVEMSDEEKEKFLQEVHEVSEMNARPNPADIPDFEDRWKKQGRAVRVLKFPQVTLSDVNSTFSANELREIADFLDGLDD